MLERCQRQKYEANNSNPILPARDSEEVFVHVFFDTTNTLGLLVL